MTVPRFSQRQLVSILKAFEHGTAVEEICLEYGISTDDDSDAKSRGDETGTLTENAAKPSTAAAGRLEQQQNILEAVFESMAEGVVVADLDGRFLVVNPVARRIAGRDPADIEPEQWPETYGAFHADTNIPIKTEELILLKAIRGEVTENFEVFFRNPQNPDGIYVNASARPLYDDNGDISGGMLIMTDITERKRAERERETLIADLERRNAELERFAYTISHDLQAPLVTIKGFLGLLKRDLAHGDNELIQTDMGQIGEAADTMKNLLDDLLELSRVGRDANAIESVSLHKLARDAVALMAGCFDESAIEITIAKEMPVVVGDPVRLLEVLQNLIENAAKFMGEQNCPRIEIGTRYDDGQAVCYVRDNGIGIDPDYRQKVFGLFERLDLRVEGTGIGLALVKRIIDMHDGSVWVESEGEGSGSTFCFTIGDGIPASGDRRSTLRMKI